MLTSVKILRNKFTQGPTYIHSVHCEHELRHKEQVEI
jgi:hypothetical protein